MNMGNQQELISRVHCNRPAPPTDSQQLPPTLAAPDDWCSGESSRKLTNGKTEYHILNLGAGVQSTTLYLMFMRGEIRPQIDCAIFADTQEEPAAVYRHLRWLQSLGGPEIIVRTKGKLGDDLARGVNSTGQRFAAVPCFTTDGATVGQMRRQCSKEYKTEVIERAIRRDVLGLEPRRRAPKGVTIHQYMGISLDEAGRARRISEMFKRTRKRAILHFPLIERFMTRPDCLTYLADKVPHQTPRSACVFCPYHSDAEWLSVKANPGDWGRAVDVDRALRIHGNIVNRTVDQPAYLHRTCKPLDEVVFDTRPRPRDLQLSMSFAAVCEGVCGV